MQHALRETCLFLCVCFVFVVLFSRVATDVIELKKSHWRPVQCGLDGDGLRDDARCVRVSEQQQRTQAHRVSTEASREIIIIHVRACTDKIANE